MYFLELEQTDMSCYAERKELEDKIEFRKQFRA